MERDTWIIEMPAKTIDQKIEKLARITEKGFEEVHKEIRSIRKEMATKDDLKAFATKEDLKTLAAKKELRETEERLLFAIEHTEVKKQDFDAIADDVREVEKRVETLEKTR